MITVWKYLVEEHAGLSGDGWRVSIPRGAQILHVAAQHLDEPHMWVLVDTDQPLEERLFRVYSTGVPVVHEPGGDLQHVGTYLINDGHTVGLLFEVHEG